MSLGLAQNQPRLSCPEEDTALGLDDAFPDPIPGVSSWEECGEYCNLNSGCQFWDWSAQHDGITGYCALKTSKNGLHVLNGWYSGEKGCP